MTKGALNRMSPQKQELILKQIRHKTKDLNKGLKKEYLVAQLQAIKSLIDEYLGEGGK